MTNLPVPSLAAPVVGNPLSQSYLTGQMYNALSFLLNPPLFQGYQATGNQSVNGSAITMDSETADTYNGHSTTTNTSRYTAQVAGYYLVWGGVCVNGATSQTEINVWVTKNGTEVTGTRDVDVANSSHTYSIVSIPQQVFLNIGDYVELYASADGTTPTTHGGTTQTSSLNALWVHA